MAWKNFILPILALVACLLVRDVEAYLNYIPGYFIFAEILEEKEQSGKSEKEGKKEMDESQIPLFLVTPADLFVYSPAIPIREELNHTSLPYKILYPLPTRPDPEQLHVTVHWRTA